MGAGGMDASGVGGGMNPAFADCDHVLGKEGNQPLAQA